MKKRQKQRLQIQFTKKNQKNKKTIHYHKLQSKCKFKNGKESTKSYRPDYPWREPRKGHCFWHHEPQDSYPFEPEP